MATVEFISFLCIFILFAKCLENANQTDATSTQSFKNVLKLELSITEDTCNTSDVGQFDINCLNWIWLSVGCTEEGYSYPELLPLQDQEMYFTSTLQ